MRSRSSCSASCASLNSVQMAVAVLVFTCSENCFKCSTRVSGGVLNQEMCHKTPRNTEQRSLPRQGMLMFTSATCDCFSSAFPCSSVGVNILDNILIPCDMIRCSYATPSLIHILWPHCPWRCINNLDSASLWCSIKIKTLWFIHSWTSERPAGKTLDTISSGGRVRRPSPFSGDAAMPQICCHVVSLCARLTDRIHLRTRVWSNARKIQSVLKKKTGKSFLHFDIVGVSGIFWYVTTRKK